MGLKDIISNFSKGRREHAEKIRELDEEVRVNKLVQERQLSSNERELRGYMREKHEARIDQMVARERKRKTNEFLHGAKTYEHKNIFKGHKSIMKQPDVIGGHKSILQQKRIF